MIENDYKDISPFEGQDFEDAISRLSQYPQLLNNFTDIISRHSRIVNAYKRRKAKDRLVGSLSQVHDYDQFQQRITCDLFLNLIVSSSIDKLTSGGILELGDDRPHIYISNHRDIVLDTALLDYVLYLNRRMTCEMVIGDNLLINQFVTDLFKVNGAITVKRSASSASELRDITLHLSKYINHCATEKNRSVWIAQKSGRSKDGVDNTSPAIIKMLYLAAREKKLSFQDFLSTVSIVPVSISYQYDPCAVTKGQEEIRKLRAEGCYDVYKKKKYADVLDMVRGLRMDKGNVHIQVGHEVPCTLTNPSEVVEFLDREIHQNYRLWDTNWFCYDYLNSSDENRDKYRSLNTKAFLKRYNCYEKSVFEFVLNSYANPVRSYLAEKNS